MGSRAAARAARASLQYPRLALYRSILRAHQSQLPEEHRALGDAYVKAEFRLHREAEPQFAAQFDRQWRDYLGQLLRPSADGAPGRAMTEDEVAALSDEQKVQLLKIHEGAAGPAKVKV